MVLLTLLGLYAFYQRERKKVNNTHSGQDENVDQSDDGEPSYQDITSDPEVRCTAEEPITGEPEVSDDRIQDQSMEDPITADLHDDKDSSDDDVYYSLPEDTVAPQLSQLQDKKRTIMDINSCRYEIGIQLGEGGFGTVHAATRFKDNLQVAVKFASKEHTEYVSVDRYSIPVPLEVALHIRANEPRVPQIIQLLDWQDEADRYIMVLERPMPCQSLDDFLESYTGTMDEEDLARVIMRQVTFAAQTCCQNGVFHRDIKLENLLINPDTLEVKLIDFGCGEMLTSAGYTSFAGTMEYCPPEYMRNEKYHGEPATVWSLGIALFVMLCGGDFPERQDLDKIIQNIWTRDGLSQECCNLICCCLQINPTKRIELEKVSLHNWFKME